MTDPQLVPVGLQLALGLILVAFLGWVVQLIRKQRLSLRESLLWLVSTLIALCLVAFPPVLQKFAVMAGVKVPSNALFGGAFLYVLVNLLSMTLAVSRNAVHARRLSQECALLRAEIEQLRAGMQRLTKRTEGK
jgi:hypothetical protein